MVAPSGHEAERWRSRQERGINPCPVPGRAPQLRQRSRRSRRAGPRREPRTVSEASRRLRADWWGDASVGGRVCERLSIAHIKVAADDPTTLADHPRCHTRLVALRRFGVCLVASGLSAERLRGPPRADRPKRETWVKPSASKSAASAVRSRRSVSDRSFTPTHVERGPR